MAVGEVEIIDNEAAVLEEIPTDAIVEDTIGGLIVDDPIWNDAFEGDVVRFEDTLPLFDPESIVADATIDMDFEIIIPDPTLTIEESKDYFLDASNVIVPVIPPAIHTPKPAKTHKNKSLKQHEGLGVGGFFAILIFVSLLIYIFRKCRVLMRPGGPGPLGKNASDHLSSLL